MTVLRAVVGTSTLETSAGTESQSFKTKIMLSRHLPLIPVGIILVAP